jgi:hypothetical protein
VDKHHTNLDLVYLKRELLSEGWGVNVFMGKWGGVRKY